MTRSQTCRRAALVAWNSDVPPGAAHRGIKAVCQDTRCQATAAVRAATRNRLGVLSICAALLCVCACSQAPAPSKAPQPGRAIALNAEQRKELRREAEIAYSSAKFDRAVELFTQLIAAEPEELNHYLWRAQAYQRWDKPAKAREDFGAAVRMAPMKQEPYLQRSKFAHAQGQLEPALADCARAIELGGPLTAGALVMRAGMHLGRGDAELALADCDRAIQLDPELLTAYNNRGLAHQSLGKNREALADFTFAIEHHRQYADPYNNRGALSMRLGRAQEALADLNEAIRLDPLNPNGYDNRSRLLLEQLHDPAGADKDCTRLLQVVEREAKQRGAKASGRKTAAIYARRALARAELNDASAALADCQAALAIDPQSAPAKELLRQLAEKTTQERIANQQPFQPHPDPGAALQLKTEH